MGKIVHFEIPSSDTARTRKFYSEAFEWDFEEMPGMDYWMTKAGPSEAPGINGAVMKRNHPEQPLTIQISVEDIDATLASIPRAGGTVVVPKASIPGMGHYAYFKDPDGVIIGVWQMDPGAK